MSSGRSPHRDDRELHLLVDVIVGELYVAEVFLDLERKLAVFLRLDDSFVLLQANDDALWGQTWVAKKRHRKT